MNMKDNLDDAPPPYSLEDQLIAPPSPYSLEDQPIARKLDEDGPTAMYTHQPGRICDPITHKYTNLLVQRVTFSTTPTAVQCPECHQLIVTKVKFVSSWCTYLSAAFCLCIGCYLGCCLLPFCVDSCKDAVHSCPHCQRVICTYKRL